MKTYTYTIYHIPGIKIGCTCDFQKRMNDQGFTNWEILWQEEGDYEFGWIAGNKEIELQKQYGLPVDTSNYQISRQNRHKFNGTETTYKLTFEDKSKGGKKSGMQNAESGHMKRISKLGTEASLRKIICEHCSKPASTFNYSRWHGDNCKHKKSL